MVPARSGVWDLGSDWVGAEARGPGGGARAVGAGATRAIRAGGGEGKGAAHVARDGRRIRPKSCSRAACCSLSEGAISSSSSSEALGPLAREPGAGGARHR